MGIFDGCLLASDIDETLVHAGEIPQKNIDKIEWLCFLCIPRGIQIIAL